MNRLDNAADSRDLVAEVAREIDPAACYLDYGPLVLHRCRQLLRDEERARDAMHDVFVKLLRYRDRLDDSAPASLLYRMATNVCLNLLRTARRRPQETADSPDEQVARGADPAVMADVRRTLAWLFAGERESTATMALLHFRDGMSLKEVADAVGMSASAVRRRLDRLRERAPSRPPLGLAA